MKVPVGMKATETLSQTDTTEAKENAKQHWYPALKEPLCYDKYIEEAGAP